MFQTVQLNEQSHVATDGALEEGVHFPQRVMSSIQPASSVGRGHSVATGPIRGHIKLHHRFPGDLFLMIADYQALTRGINPTVTRAGIFELAAIYLALGLDVNKAVLYCQSDIPEITELAWILSCTTATEALLANPVYQGGAGQTMPPDARLLIDPFLMTASVLAIRSTIVSISSEQAANLEKVQKVARAFNRTVDEDFFPIPERSSVDAGHAWN